jgi:hypothetical protein
VNVAYVISAYKLPELLLRLVRRLDDPRASFFIHVDARAPAAVYDAMHSPLRFQPNVHFLPRHACYWGDFGHVDATMKGLAAAVQTVASPAYVVLLTGQDYPLVASDAIPARLAEGDGAVYMESFPLPTRRWPHGGLDRIEHAQFRIGQRLIRVPGQPFKLPLAASAWMRTVRALGLTRSFPGGLKPYGGSSYWAMPVECAEHVLRFAAENQTVMRFFERTAIPDEMVFQTILMNSAARDHVVQDTLRYIDWSGDGDSPAVLTSRHLADMTASGALFARKFDPGVDADVLDLIDRACLT